MQYHAYKQNKRKCESNTCVSVLYHGTVEWQNQRQNTQVQVIQIQQTTVFNFSDR
jgi:hypothetical protein